MKHFKIILLSKRVSQKGATLVELLLVMGLLSFMIVVLATIFTSAVEQQQLSRNYSSVTSNGRFIMARLNYDISRATAVATPASLGSSAASLVMTVNSTTYTYALSGNNLQLNDGTSTDNLNDGVVKVSSVSFQRFGNVSGKPTITYTFTVTGLSSAHGINSAQTFTSTVELK